LSTLLQQLINGVSLGAIYALIALGYTMVYGVLRFINFAHGDVFMLGAFAGFYVAPIVARVLPLPGVAGMVVLFLVSMTLCALLGVIIERLAYRPLRNRPKLTVLITAIGVSLLIEYSGQKVFSANPRPFPTLAPPFHLGMQIGGEGRVEIDANQTVLFVVTLLLLWALHTIVWKTKMGTAMRAVSLNQQAAALVGVNIDRVISFTFALGSALAGAAGILYSMLYPSIDPLMGIMPGLKAFIAAVLGGIGNIPGAALGGLILGALETLVAGYLSSRYRDGIAFAALIVILLWKPSGLLGKREIEKV
jgi:branched-chain amino acid transport system permease protein